MSLVLLTGNGPEHRYVANRLCAELPIDAVVVDVSTRPPTLGPAFRMGKPWQRFPPIVVPKALDRPIDGWLPELEEFQRAIVHSKVVVLDPFGAHPVVIAGSHNLGREASTTNDENLVIVEGNQALAQAYAVNLMSIYAHYRFRYQLHMQRTYPQIARGAGSAEPTALRGDDRWQADLLAGESSLGREWRFWLG